MEVCLLKESLIELGLVTDNEYLDKYCELIELNENTKKEQFKTQCHHIIPRYYYRINHLKLNNQKENLVNLTHEDHFWAHYYLALCSKEEYIYYSEKAVESILECNYKILSKKELESKAILYSKLKKDYYRRDSERKKGKPNLKLRGQFVGRKYSKETLDKMSAAWHNRTEEEKQKISKLRSELAKGRIVSEETKQKLRESKIGTKYNKHIPLYLYNIKEKLLINVFNNYEEVANVLGTSKGVVTETVFEKINYNKIYFVSKSPLTNEELELKYDEFINKKRKEIDRDYPLHCYNIDNDEYFIFKNIKRASQELNLKYNCISVCFEKDKGPFKTYKGWIFSRSEITQEQINYFKNKRKKRKND